MRKGTTSCIFWTLILKHSQLEKYSGYRLHTSSCYTHKEYRITPTFNLGGVSVQIYHAQKSLFYASLFGLKRNQKKNEGKKEKRKRNRKRQRRKGKQKNELRRQRKGLRKQKSRHGNKLRKREEANWGQQGCKGTARGWKTEETRCEETAWQDGDST